MYIILFYIKKYIDIIKKYIKEIYKKYIGIKNIRRNVIYTLPVLTYCSQTLRFLPP